MNPAQYVVRRANLDDLPGLKQLWERAGMQVLDLERRLTEFQLVSSSEGDLVVAVALHVEGRNALLHSEAFVRREEEDGFRQMLWDRLKTLARNHGVARVWTREEAPFWHREAGFIPAEGELVQRLPARFGEAHHRWHTVALREDAPDAVSWEHEFELFQQSSRASAEQTLAQARRVRAAALTVGLVLFFAAMAFGCYLLIKWMGRPGSGRL